MYNAHYNEHDDKAQFWIFNYYLKDYHDHLLLTPGLKISNPLLGEPQKTPSFNIFQLRKGKWKYKDFATNDRGDICDLLQALFKISFKQAKHKIHEDWAEIEDFKNATEAKMQQAATNSTTINATTMKNYFKITEREPIEEDKLFWFDNYGINRKILDEYNVKFISSFSTSGKLIKPNGVTYAYDLGKGYKIYQPYGRDYKFTFIGQKEEKFIFGYKQLPKTGTIVFITGGEKDTLTIRGQGYYAICLNSETASLPKWLYEDLKKRFEKIVVIYDNDKTGIEYSDKLCKEYGLEKVSLPAHENAKDISDFIKLKYSFEELLAGVLPSKSNPVFSVKSFYDLAMRGNSLQAIKKIWGCYVLEGSLIVFPAERGVGKTYLMLELALAVANGETSFCGESIELHGNTLYINLELSEELISRRINKLIQQLPSRRFTFEPICLTIKGNLEKHFPEIERVIRWKKPVLVIIDNLRAASSHLDNEKNKAMTVFIQQRLQPLIEKYNSALILVHHTKKGTQYQRLNSDMQSGAGALTDLADGDFFLARSTQNKNYRLLKRLKSRSCEEQDDAKLLYLNPETLWFELKAESVNEFDHISFETRDSEKSKQTEEMKKLHAEGKTLEEIAAIFDVNKSTVSRRINK